MTVDGIISVKEKSLTSSFSCSYISPADIVSNIIESPAVYPKNIKKIKGNSMREYSKKKTHFILSVINGDNCI